MTIMADEINQQPDAVAQTIEALLPLAPQLRALAEGRRHVTFFARGTSDNAATYGRYLLECHAGLSASLGAPSLATHYGAEPALDDTLVVALSQSGETDEIVEVTRWASRQGARTVAITNSGGSRLATMADLALVTAAGQERAVPATKSYTCQLAAVGVLAAALGPRDGRLEAALQHVPGEMARLLDTPDITPAAEMLERAAVTVVSGRGLVHGTALEFALKLEETSLIPIRALSYADLRHGPIAVVDDSVTAVLLASPDGPMLPGLRSLQDQLHSLGAKSLVIGGDMALRDRATACVEGPALPELVAPIALIVPGQRLAERVARLRGLDPDQPRTLSKVTQTDRPTRIPTS